jgi:hypothetical protein
LNLPMRYRFDRSLGMHVQLPMSSCMGYIQDGIMEMDCRLLMVFGLGIVKLKTDLFYAKSPNKRLVLFQYSFAPCCRRFREPGSNSTFVSM